MNSLGNIAFLLVVATAIHVYTFVKISNTPHYGRCSDNNYEEKVEHEVPLDDRLMYLVCVSEDVCFPFNEYSDTDLKALCFSFPDMTIENGYHEDIPCARYTEEKEILND